MPRVGAGQPRRRSAQHPTGYSQVLRPSEEAKAVHVISRTDSPGSPGSVRSSEDRHSDVENRVEQVTDEVAEEVATTLADRPWIASVTRVGWVAKGVVYGSMGWAATAIARARGAHEADAEYTGIINLLVERSLTRFLLGVIAVGLVFYIAFRVLSVLLIDDNGADAWAHRIGFGFSALVYAAVAWVAAVAAIEGGHQDESSVVERVSMALLESTPGRALLAVGAIGSIAVAAYFLVKGVTLRFMQQVKEDELSPLRRRIVAGTGAAGWVGRSLIVGAVGLYVLRAALESDPTDVSGLDRTMHRLATTDFGSMFVTATGLLLLVYAGYCLISAPYRCLAWSDEHDPDARHPLTDRPLPHRDDEERAS